MSLGKIYSYPNNWRVARARAAAVLGGADIEEVTIEMSKTKEPEFLAKFPAGIVPAFEGTDGTKITQSIAIATYAALKAPSGKLLSTEPKTAAEIAEWVAFADQEIAVPHGAIAGMIAGYIAYAKPVYTSLFTKVEQRLASLNEYLQDKTYLVGDRVTLADIAVGSALFPAFTTNGHVDAEARAKIPNVVRYFETIVKSSKLAPVFGEVAYVEKAPQYQAPKKEAAKKPEAAPKAPKAPKEKKAAENDDEDDEPLVPAEPKAKNPLDDLPKSDFKLDDWKRSYSNDETVDAIKWFYENFDNEGYSIWKIDYKYNDELTQVFMSSNLIGGLYARLEASRKYLMGSAAVFGKAHDSVISGVFVARGQDAETVFSCAPDWTSYEFTKLDIKKDEDKTFFENLLKWEGTVAGKEFADGKIFK